MTTSHLRDLVIAKSAPLNFDDSQNVQFDLSSCSVDACAVLCQFWNKSDFEPKGVAGDWGTPIGGTFQIRRFTDLQWQLRALFLWS